MENKLVLLFLFVFPMAVAQEKMIHIKITANGNDAADIDVVNLVNEKAAKSDANGEFQILAKTGDLLVFNSERFEYKRKLIDEDDLKEAVILINVTPKPSQLEEVVITEYRKINAVDLGIMSKHAKEYTPAERRLKTAGDFKPIQLLGILGGSLPIDPILNAINGRTKRLKKEINIERREARLQEIEGLYDAIFYTKNLKIPVDYIMGFKYFLAEDDDFATLLSAKNKPAIEMQMVTAAAEYLKTIADEE